MANIKSMLFSILSHVLPDKAALPLPPESRPDRLYFDLIGLSDADAMWYYEVRKWRGRD